MRGAAVAVLVEDVDQRPDRELAEHGVPQMPLPVDGVPVPTTDFRLRDVALGEEVAEDALRGAFRDPDPVGDVARAGFRVARHGEEHVRVVREEVPLRLDGRVSHERECTASCSRLRKRDLQGVSPMS